MVKDRDIASCCLSEEALYAASSRGRFLLVTISLAASIVMVAPANLIRADRKWKETLLSMFGGF